MDLGSLQFGADNYQLSRAINMNQSATLLSGLPSLGNSNPLSVDLLNQIQDSQLVSARVINYYDQRVESTFEELGFERGNFGSTTSQAPSNSDDFETSNLGSLNGGEEPEDIQTIVDEIIDRNEEVPTGTLLDIDA